MWGSNPSPGTKSVNEKRVSNLLVLLAKLRVGQYTLAIMLGLQKVSKSFGEKAVLEEITFSLNSGEVIALVGENGTGKTTLLKLVAGEIPAESGRVINDHETIGYLTQDHSLGDTIENSFEKTIPTWQIQRSLEKTGLSEKETNSLVTDLSGGQKTRLALARILSHDPEPTVLLLDEPTNNIDAEGREWLINFIRQFSGGVLFASHDRLFINQLAEKVIELDKGKLKVYGGNYDFYRFQKQAERDAELQRYETAVEEKRRLEKVRQEKISFMLKTGTESFDKLKHESKVKFNAKKNTTEKNLGRQIGAVESRIDQLKEVERPENISSHKLNISGETPTPKLITRAHELSGAYGLILFRNLNFEIHGNERVRVIGPNGSGKSTLLKIMAGILEPESGTVTIGVGVGVGYFSQEITNIDPNTSCLANLQTVSSDRTAIHSLAKTLRLNALDLVKKPNELSRGQVAKLAFAKLLISSNQLLILDEPTNHLDILTRERIEAALRGYRGAMLVASHDEYFLNEIGISRELVLKD